MEIAGLHGGGSRQTHRAFEFGPGQRAAEQQPPHRLQEFTRAGIVAAVGGSGPAGDEEVAIGFVDHLPGNGAGGAFQGLQGAHGHDRRARPHRDQAPGSRNRREPDVGNDVIAEDRPDGVGVLALADEP